MAQNMNWEEWEGPKKKNVKRGNLSHLPPFLDKTFGFWTLWGQFLVWNPLFLQKKIQPPMSGVEPLISKSPMSPSTKVYRG